MCSVAFAPPAGKSPMTSCFCLKLTSVRTEPECRDGRVKKKQKKLYSSKSKKVTQIEIKRGFGEKDTCYDHNI